MGVGDAMILLGIILMIYTLVKLEQKNKRRQRYEDMKYEEWKNKTHTWGSRRKRDRRK